MFYSSSQVLKALPVAAPVPAPFREDSRAKFERALDAILTFGGSEKEKEENNNDRRPEIVAAWQEWAVRVPQSDSAMEHWALHPESFALPLQEFLYGRKECNQKDVVSADLIAAVDNCIENELFKGEPVKVL